MDRDARAGGVMRSVQVTDRAVRAVLLGLVDDDIAAAAWEEHAAAERAEVDALIVEELGGLVDVDALVAEAARSREVAA